MDTHHTLASKRARMGGVAAPTLKRFRVNLRGLTYKRPRRETHDRRPKLTRQNIMKMSSKRKQLIKKAQGQREVRWEDVRKASRVQRVHRSTLHRSFQKVGLGVKARSPRLKPGRTPAQAALPLRSVINYFITPKIQTPDNLIHARGWLSGRS